MTPEQFITRWQSADGSERANYQIFIADLCELLDLPKPDPAQDDTRENGVSALANVSGAKVKPRSGGLSHNAYVFERRVTFRHGDGSTSNGFIDCYRRGSAIIEAKKLRLGKETKVSTTPCCAPGQGPKPMPAPCRRKRAGRRS